MHPRGLNPHSTGSTCRCGALRGGACLACRLLPPAFSLLSCPLSPRPRSQSALPHRGRGSLRLFYARGSAPCIPGAEPARHWLDLPLWFPAGGCVLPRLFFLPYNRFFAPIPPPPLPGGKGETFTLFRRELPPPAPRALNRLRHLQNLPSRCPEGRTRAALLIGNRFLSFLRRTMGSAPGMQGAKPLA